MEARRGGRPNLIRRGPWERASGAAFDLLAASAKLDLNPFFRPRSADVLEGEDTPSAQSRHGLYAQYLETHLP